jgi:IstB-like ATP binding protein
MMDQLVCADGGNPDPTTTQGKDAAKAKEIELSGWDCPKHLAGRLFSLVVHGDAEGVIEVRRALSDWLRSMELESAGEAADLSRYLGYWKPAIGERPRPRGRSVMTTAATTIDSIKNNLVALRMPRALEVLDATLRRIEQGEIDGIEALDQLLLEERTMRENRRVRTALTLARLSTVKSLVGFDFAFQPSLDKKRILALAQLDFIDRNEVIHFLGPPGTGKTHLASALAMAFLFDKYCPSEGVTFLARRSMPIRCTTRTIVETRSEYS